MNLKKTEFLIIGAGIVGLTMARELIKTYPQANIIIIEKESSLGKHASGRNSGILHAGIYYPPDTLKAKLCLQGNLLLQAYCKERNLKIAPVGKFIVARDETEIPQIDLLYHRAKQNGADVEIIDEQQLAQHEPYAKTTQIALHSKNTAIIDNQEILKSIYDELIQSKKVTFLFDTAFEKIKSNNTAIAAQHTIQFDWLINAAGAYADKIAHAFDLANDYYFIPFKGIYRKIIPSQSHIVNGNIYPVPDLNNPFLGVHFSKNIRGEVYVGPTAIPAFGRENYGIFTGIDREIFKIIYHQMTLFISNQRFRSVALTEPKKYFKQAFFNDAKRLVKHLDPNWLIPTTKLGIRPQLIDIKKKELLMDFIVMKDQRSIHILNAISPAFTSSMAFSNYIINKYLN